MIDRLPHKQGLFSVPLRAFVKHVLAIVSEPMYRQAQVTFSRLGRHALGPGEVNWGPFAVSYLDLPSFASTFEEIAIQGIYDLGDIHHRPFFIDAGANIGLAQLYWKRRYGDFDSVAIEADPKVAATLTHNLQRWGCATPVRLGLLGVDGKGFFLPDGKDGGHIVEDKAEGAIEVDGISLDSVLTRECDLLKIDIEGAELQVLESCCQLHLAKRIFVESHSYAGSPQDVGPLLTLLNDRGYHCYARPGVIPRNPWKSRPVLPNGLDFTLNILAVKRGSH